MAGASITPLEFKDKVVMVEQTRFSADSEPTPPQDSNTGPENRHPLMRAVRSAAGIFLILFGILGCVLPVIPGLPILAAGILLLGPNHWIVRKGRKWIHEKREQAAASPRFRKIHDWIQKKRSGGER
jgi:hypothetical protein